MTIGIAAGFFLVPLGVTFALYYKIFSNILKAISFGLTVKSKPTGGLVNEPQTAKETSECVKRKSSRRRNWHNFILTLNISKDLFISLAITALTVIPVLIISVFEFDRGLSLDRHIYVWIFFRLCACLNPIVYPFFHSSYWHGYINVYEHVIYTKRQRTLSKKNKSARMRRQKEAKKRDDKLHAYLIRQQDKALKQKAQLFSVQNIQPINIS